MKNKKTSISKSPKFSLAIKHGTKNVLKEIDILCDKLIADAIGDEVIEFATKMERNKFKMDFHKWIQIESQLDHISEENINEINKDLEIQKRIKKLGVGMEVLEEVEKIAKKITEGKISRFLNEGAIDRFILERNAKIKSSNESNQKRKLQRQASLGIINKAGSSLSTNKDEKKIWFQVGLLFANGSMDKLKTKFHSNATKIAIHLKNISYRPFISESFSNTNKSDKNIFSNKAKLQTIYDYCQANNIPVVDTFKARIQAK